MAEKTLKTRIQHKHETEANWSQATGFVPLAGELIIYDVDETHSKPRFKIGDGVRNPDTGKIEGTNVNDLPFVSDGAIINVSETDITSIVMNDESNIAGSFGFNVIEGYSEVVDNVTYGYYKIDMELLDNKEDILLQAIEDFNIAMSELEASDLTEEEKLQQRQVALDLFKDDTNHQRYDASAVYILNIVKAPWYQNAEECWQIQTQGFVYFSNSTENPRVFGSGSYIRLINYPKIGTVNVDGYSFAAGINNKAIAVGSFAVGKDNIANGAYSAVFGRNNKVAYNSAAYGRNNTVNAQMGTVYGQYNIVNGHDSTVTGLRNETWGGASESFVAGIKNIANAQAQTVVGAANAPDKDALFIVGNGEYDRADDLEPSVRNNAYAVKKDGSAALEGGLSVGGDMSINGKINTNGDINVNGMNVLKQPLAFTTDELPVIGETNKIYIVDKNEYVYISKPDSKKSEVWSGKLAEGFSKGSGSESDPYIIETAEEFATMVNGKVITYDISTTTGDDYKTGSVAGDWYGYYYPLATNGTYKFNISYSGPYVFSVGYTDGTTFYETDYNDGTVIVPEGYYLACSTSGPESDWYITDSTGSRNVTIITKTPIISEIGEAYFKLNNNIYLNDTNKGSWYNDNTNKPWFKGSFKEYYVKDIDGNDTEETTTFLGHINGNGYTVNGIWYGEDSNTSSLIPVAQNGTTIKNLGIDNSYIVSVKVGDNRGWSAGFVADTISGAITFENCYVGTNVYIYTMDSTACSGGFLGYARKNTNTTPHTIINCYNLMPASHYKGSSNKCNGFIGEVWQTYCKIENCYSIYKPFEGSGNSLAQGTFNNVYSISGSTTAAMALYTKITEEELKSLNLGEAFGLTDNYPQLTAFGYWEQISSATAGSESFHIWNGTIATEFASGIGSEVDPYIIETPEQFALVVENFGGGYYYKIVNDLYFNDINLDKTEWANAEWYCKSKETTESTDQKYYYENKAGVLGTFNGYIDGNGHSLYGLYHKDNTHYCVGLIPTMGNGYIKNLALKNSEFVSGTRVGGFIGTTARLAFDNGTITIENCFVDGTVVLTSNNNKGTGGIIGYTVVQSFTIKNCYCLSTQLNSNSRGGLVGEAWNSPYALEKCYSILQPVPQDNVARKPTSCKNVYSTETDNRYGGIWTRISNFYMQGLSVLNSSMPGLIGEYVITSTYPTLKTFVTESEAIASDAYVKAFSEATIDLSNYQEKIADITKENGLTTRIKFTTDTNENLADTANITLNTTNIDLAAYSSIYLYTHNGDIVLDSFGDIDASNNRIKNVAIPTEDTDAVNKKYVDDLIAALRTELNL